MVRKSDKGIPIGSPTHTLMVSNPQNRFVLLLSPIWGFPPAISMRPGVMQKFKSRNRIAEQLQAEVGLLQERSNKVLRVVTSGKEVGGTTLKVINQNFQQTSLVGLRYLSTYFHPDPISPERVFVLGCVRVDFADMAKTILAEMEGAAKLDKEMEYDHQEAMLRFDEVRKQYLGEKGVQDILGE